MGEHRQCRCRRPPFRATPVSQIQQVLGKECTAELWWQGLAGAERILRLLDPCDAERAACAGKQRRNVSNSSANISTFTCLDNPWSSKMFPSSGARDVFVFTCSWTAFMLRVEKKHHTCWCVCDCEGTLKQFNDPSHTHAKNEFNSLKILSLCNKNRRIPTSRLNSEGLVAHVPSFFSRHNPLLSCHSPSTVRKGLTP